MEILCGPVGKDVDGNVSRMADRAEIFFMNSCLTIWCLLSFSDFEITLQYRTKSFTSIYMRIVFIVAMLRTCSFEIQLLTIY